MLLTMLVVTVWVTINMKPKVMMHIMTAVRMLHTGGTMMILVFTVAVVSKTMNGMRTTAESAVLLLMLLMSTMMTWHTMMRLGWPNAGEPEDPEDDGSDTHSGTHASGTGDGGGNPDTCDVSDFL